MILLLVLCLAGFASATEAERIGKKIRDRWPAERSIDEMKLKNDGVRRLDGKYLVLYTDLPKSKEVDELPQAFDQLIPLLCDYFELSAENYDDFKAEGFLIDDFEKFKSGGAVRQVPELRHGYAMRCRFWLRNQKSDYYRRHLFLHEGIHVFMGYAFGAWGPPWYREGTAELLGTHRLKDGRLELAWFPEVREPHSHWDRIRYIRNDVQQGQAKTVEEIFDLASEDYDENTAYAWSWAFAAFCENKQKYRNAFRRTARHLTGDKKTVAQRFFELIVAEQPELDNYEILYRMENDWANYLANLDYGYDFKRTKIDHTPSEQTVDENAKTVEIRADAGWQNSGFRLEKGKTYDLTASGRFQLGEEPKPWISEPNGVTLRYHSDHPIGMLFATLVPDYNERFVAEKNSIGVRFSQPKVIGTGTAWTPNASGTLFFRINDFASGLYDNHGTATVRIIQRAGGVGGTPP